MTNSITEEEAIALIRKIVSIQAACYYIVGYERADMEQEGFIICWKAYKTKWDGVRPLENFLVIHLSRRFKNLVRDITKAQGSYIEAAKNLMSPISLDSVNWDNESICYEDDIYENIRIQECKDKINSSIPPYLKKDFLKMLDGVKISKTKSDKIKEIMYEISE